MDKLIFLVCENFYLEYKKIVEDEGFEDVFISPYPSVCENKSKKNEIINKLEETASDGYDYILICSKYCDLLKWMPEKSKIKVHTSNFCFNKLVNDEFMKYIISKGSYVISSSWLKNWKQHIETQGFDKETAMNLYF